MTLPELADYMLKLGAHQAINLDGGGSTAMVVRNLYVNGNSDGEPRAVANALLVFSQNPDSAPQEPGRPTEIPPVQLAAGSSTPITLNLPDLAASGARPIWGSTDGRSFVDQRGMLNTRKAGTLEIAAWLNGSALRIPLTVLPGSPEKLTATLAAAPNNPPDRRLVVITVKDRFGNPIPGIPVTIKVAGGVPDYPEVKTDSAGRAEVEVIWDTEMGGAVTIQSGLLAPIVLKSK
jgi:hypothetical protein